ncbi:hypothetical protein RLO149_c036860 [Roseobacter litoralis Och 149]|uniref:Uncharacterized protein n=1 Tax=Roseobacter litoralis (strain ATCC 49566 / DSM 6996 / JCM 21268 / NBRC 15278 / OCh 149) TaxID=391595 RepID=F7ZBM2_ROSLO|nr:hypothetical protein RLO149_c036860 [Roseobacter litoralis Och 149]
MRSLHGATRPDVPTVQRETLAKPLAECIRSTGTLDATTGYL